MNKQIVVIGGGISGLASAFWLKKNNYNVIVLDKNKEPGGVMESLHQNGYMFDRGPNSGLEVTPLIKQIVDEVGLSSDFVYANDKGDKRYILRNNTLHALPMSPKLFLMTKLFSWKAKLRLFAEPFAKRSKDGYYQSLADFVKRRLGNEFLDYAINPFVAGVYAGRPEKLSVKSGFPKLYALEENYGGLIIGSIRSARARKKRTEVAKQSAKMFSFLDGMQSFPKAVAGTLGDALKLDSEVTSISKTEDNKYKIEYISSGEEKILIADVVISAIPAYAASGIFKNYDEKLSSHLSAIYYPPVLVMYLIYKKEAVKRPLDGFGFLIPSKERKSFLGAIWSSVLFPKRVPDDKAAFTLFVGGARNPEILTSDKDLLIKKVIAEFQEIMLINEKPVQNSFKIWNKAIPQYNVGYIEHENYFEEFEKKNKGIIISGNFRGGIAVGDCIKNSELTYNKTVEFLNIKNGD